MVNRALAFALAALPAFALSNAVTIQEQSGSTQTNRVISIPRYFAQGELCLNPRPYSGGPAVAFWQTDVKTRWPADAACVGGYVRFALITVEIPSLAGNGTFTVEFRSDAASSSSGSGLTKTQMLAFDAGGGAASWGAKTTVAVGALSASASARAMIGSDHYQVLESGPLRTSVLVREGPDAVSAVTTRTTSIGFQCTANCVAPYDTATWVDNSAYYSMRPSFVVTFYSPHTGTGSVEVDHALDDGWLDRAQDQRLESLVLYNGGAETSACYTAPAAFILSFRARFFETCWSTVPPAINIDFNRAYVTYTKVLPAYGLNWVVGASAIALELADFTASDQGVTTNTTIAPSMGNGQDRDIGGAAGGASPVIGMFTRWDSRYLNNFDPQLLSIVLGNAKAGMHMPLFPLESSTTAPYLTGNSAKAFGRIASIDVRPTYQSSTGNGTVLADAPHSPHGDVVCNTGATCPSGAITCTAPNCMVQCAGRSGATINFCSIYTTQGIAGNGSNWGIDLAHNRLVGFAAYFATGKYVYSELLQGMASWAILAGSNVGDPPTDVYGRWGNRGLIYSSGNTTRGHAWGLRTLGGAALMTTDGSVEKAYFTQKLNNNLEHHEGRYDIRNGSFPPSDPSCGAFNKATETVIWRMGRCWDEGGRSNPLSIAMEHASSLGNSCEGCDGSLEADGLSPWMDSYGVMSFSALTDWGFGAPYILATQAKNKMHWFADSAAAPATGAGAAGNIVYRWPAMAGTAQTGARGGYIQTWQAVQAGEITSVQLAKSLDSSATTLYTPNWTATADNLFDAFIASGTYFKIGTEMIQLGSPTTLISKTVSAVDTTLDRLTVTGHGFTEGQLVLLLGNGLQNIDAGVKGNSHCRMFSGGLTDYCTFTVHIVDANTVEIYNDTAQTSRVDFTGGGSMFLYHTSWPITRGALGTTPTTHAVGDSIVYTPRVPPIQRVTNPDSHSFFYTTALAAAVDHDYTITDGLTGKTITARRAWDIIDQTVYRQNIAGANVANCGTAGLNVANCDAPTWGIRPRPLVRNVRVLPAATSAKLLYSAPDGNACQVGVSASAFASTDDTADTSDAAHNLARSYTATGLSAGATYNYRISCGPSGGAARIAGAFTLAGPALPSKTNIRGRTNPIGKR